MNKVLSPVSKDTAAAAANAAHTALSAAGGRVRGVPARTLTGAAAADHLCQHLDNALRAADRHGCRADVLAAFRAAAGNNDANGLSHDHDGNLLLVNDDHRNPR